MREKKKTMDETFSRLENKFSDFYQNSHSLWNEREVKRPFFMRDIAGNLRKKYARTFNEHPIKFILLDGMRWDLWCFLKEQFFSSLKDSYRLVDEIPLWAHSPTVTSVQVEDLLGLSSSSTGKEVSLKAAEENDMYKGQWESRLQLSDGDKIYVNRFIDGKVHTSRDSLFAMFQEIKQYLKSSLEARMDALPKRSLIFLFSDHGFKNNPRFTMSDKYREARYVHGSSSFWEVIVPLGVFLKS
jgi:hypothetical protein